VRWLLILLVACSNNVKKHDDASNVTPTEQPVPEPTSKVTIETPQGPVTVNVEVVYTSPKIERGLMYRQFLAPEAGMLFFMGQEYDWAFYMRNTLIPLDMIFITKDMTIAGIVENAEPKTETLRQVHKPSLYVLEVNGGWAAKHAAAAGNKVTFADLPAGVKQP
jgi:uncharacterized membrane protein (UPF0127 family)